MDLIKSRARRSRVSDILYIVLNVLFAGAAVGFAMAFSTPYLALLLVILSKWRIFAVRPRFWFANLQANLVDMFVGLSVVALIWQITVAQQTAGGATGLPLVQLFIAALYIAWLLLLKPRSKRIYMVWQAGIAQFVAFVALFSNAYQLDVAIVVMLAWLIGYAAARHVLGAFEEEQDGTFLSLIWGFIVAEISWLAYHWTVGYGIVKYLMIPQISIIVTLLGFVVLNLYRVYYNPHKKHSVRAPIIFAATVIVMLLIKELWVLS